MHWPDIVSTVNTTVDTISGQCFSVLYQKSRIGMRRGGGGGFTWLTGTRSPMQTTLQTSRRSGALEGAGGRARKD